MIDLQSIREAGYKEPQVEEIVYQATGGLDYKELKKTYNDEQISEIIRKMNESQSTDSTLQDGSTIETDSGNSYSVDVMSPEEEKLLRESMTEDNRKQTKDIGTVNVYASQQDLIDSNNYDFTSPPQDMEDIDTAKIEARKAVLGMPTSTDDERKTRDQYLRNISRWGKNMDTVGKPLGISNTPEEDAVSEALSQAMVISNDTKLTKLVMDAINGTDDISAYTRAGEHLLKNGIIKGYNPDKKVVELKDGRIIPFSSSILSDLWASKYEAIYGAVGGATVALATVPSPVSPYAKIATTVIGSAISSSSGARQDYLSAKSYFGETNVEPEEVIKAMALSATDDVFLGSAVAGIIKIADKVGVPQKIASIKNALLDNDLSGAWKDIVEITGKTPAEMDSFMDRASELWGEKKLNINTNEGKKQAIKFLAMYDDSLVKYTEGALATNTQAVNNLLAYSKKKTLSLKSKILNGNAQDAIKDVDGLYTQAQDLWRGTLKNIDKAFEGVIENQVSFSAGLKQELVPIERALASIEGASVDVQKAKIKEVQTLLSNVSSPKGLADLLVTYNRMLSKMATENKDAFGILLQGKTTMRNYLLKAISDNPLLDKESKAQLKEQYLKTNQLYSEAKATIDTDLYDSIVTGRGNIKVSNDIVDAILESAKRDRSDGKMNESLKLLDALDPSKLPEVEGTIMNRIINKSLFNQKEPNYANFALIDAELKQVSHLFTTPESKAIVERINKFSKLWQSDHLLAGLSGISPSEKFASGGLSTSVKGWFEIFLTSNLVRKTQLLVPALMRELGMGKILDTTDMGKKAVGVARTQAIELNIASALSKATSMPDFLSRLVLDDSGTISNNVRGISKEILNSYQKASNEFDALLPEVKQNMLDDIAKRKQEIEAKLELDRVKRQEAKANTPKRDYDKEKQDRIDKLEQEKQQRVAEGKKQRQIDRFPLVNRPTYEGEILPADETRMLPNGKLDNTIVVEPIKKTGSATTKITEEQATRNNDITKQIGELNKEKTRVQKEINLIYKGNLSQTKKAEKAKILSQSIRDIQTQIKSLESKRPKAR